MKDRIPLYPGRVKMTPVSGQANIYDMERADQPTQEGTPLSKATLLSDATAAALGLTGDDPTVDEALGSLAAHASGWVKIAEYKTAGAYEFTVPSRITKVGAVLGSGGGGGAAVKSLITNSDSLTASCSGGAAGRIGIVRPFHVTPGSNIPLVVGAGGASSTNNGSNKAGGASSFNGISINGGEGGKLKNSAEGYLAETSAGGVGGIVGDGDVSSVFDINFYNPFEDREIQIASGAGCKANGADRSIYGSNAYSGASATDGTSANSIALTTDSPGVVSPSTGICTGGSSIVMLVARGGTVNSTIQSAAGRDGVVCIYALRSEALAAGVTILE